MNEYSCVYTPLVSTTEAATQRSTTVERPPNDHDLSLALGEEIAVVPARGACATLWPLSSVVVGLNGLRLLCNSVSAPVQYGRSA